MYERLTLVLEPVEMAALKRAAQQELRKPRDQVRHILRAVLLADPPDPPMNEGHAVAIDGAGAPSESSPNQSIETKNALGGAVFGDA